MCMSVHVREMHTHASACMHACMRVCAITTITDIGMTTGTFGKVGGGDGLCNSSKTSQNNLHFGES